MSNRVCTLLRAFIFPGLFIFNIAFAQDQGEAQATVKFDIWEYQLQGNSLLNVTQIENALYPFLGPERGIEAVEAAAQSLEKAYRTAGYPTIFVDIPEQDVRSGVVTLSVTEGKIGRLRVKGSRYFTLSGIKARVPSLQEGQPLNIPQLQKEISDVNKLSGDLSVAPILKAGKNPGEVDIDLNVKDTLPVHGDLEYNNFNSPDTTRGRLRGSVSYNNLWQKAHGLILSARVSPDDTNELAVYSASYIVPWEERRLAFFAVKSSTDVESAVGTTIAGGGLNVIGDGKIAGLRLIQPLDGKANNVQSLTLGMDYKDFNEVVEKDLDKPITYLTQSIAYSSALIDVGATTRFNISANTGVRGLVNDEDEFREKRADAKAGYLFLRGGLSREDEWDFSTASRWTKDWKTRIALDGQLSASPLISNEQYSIGGYSSVRGYLESQALGDLGYALQMEIYTPALNWFRDENTPWIREARMLAFYDLGEVRIQEPFPGEEETQRLKGAGLGLHLDILTDLSLIWDYSWALEDFDTIESGDQRTNFRFLYEF